MNKTLYDFVYQALKTGASRDQISAALGKGGWSQEEIKEALQAFVDSDINVPVPRKSASTSPKEAFLYLLLFSTLFTWVFAVGSIMFDLLNLWLPEPGRNELIPYSISSLRNGIATVIIAFPFFTLINKRATSESMKNPGQRISPIRRWLTYLTLFISASCIIGDLISLTFTFLEGEITLRFSLKALTIGTLAGVAFTHYLSQLKRDEIDPTHEASHPKHAALGLSTAVLVLLVIAGWHAGSPFKARQQRQDQQRIQDLVAMQNSIQAYAREHHCLPATLEACSAQPDTFIEQLKDPVTGVPYHYRIIDPTHAEVGATFALPSSERTRTKGFWSHGMGPAQFVFEVQLDNK